jgi:hypothetical protein
MVKKSDWNGPQGSNDLGKDGPLKRQPDKGYQKPRSIADKVDKAWKINDGFASKLPPSED